LGSEFFGGIEAKVSSLFFAIPGVKGVEWGDGFALAQTNGSLSNDQIYIDKSKKIYTKTNHMGGILGGISNGMDIVANLCFKPTSSINKPMHSVNYETMQPAILKTNGRHDPCIAVRAPVIVETYLALALLELILEEHE
jgi:chorismate synthase